MARSATRWFFDLSAGVSRGRTELVKRQQLAAGTGLVGRVGGKHRAPSVTLPRCSGARPSWGLFLRTPSPSEHIKWQLALCLLAGWPRAVVYQQQFCDQRLRTDCKNDGAFLGLGRVGGYFCEPQARPGWGLFLRTPSPMDCFQVRPARHSEHVCLQLVLLVFIPASLVTALRSALVKRMVYVLRTCEKHTIDCSIAISTCGQDGICAPHL